MRQISGTWRHKSGLWLTIWENRRIAFEKDDSTLLTATYDVEYWANLHPRGYLTYVDYLVITITFEEEGDGNAFPTGMRKQATVPIAVYIGEGDPSKLCLLEISNELGRVLRRYVDIDERYLFHWKNGGWHVASIP